MKEVPSEVQFCSDVWDAIIVEESARNVIALLWCNFLAIVLFRALPINVHGKISSFS